VGTVAGIPRWHASARMISHGPSPMPKPLRCPVRLDRLANHYRYLGRERAQIDLITQASAKRLDGLGRVVLAAGCSAGRLSAGCAGELAKQNGNSEGCADGGAVYLLARFFRSSRCDCRSGTALRRDHSGQSDNSRRITSKQ
jgi:hypothetical protein